MAGEWARVYDYIRAEDAAGLAAYLAEHKTMEPTYRGHTLTGTYTRALETKSVPLLRVLLQQLPPQDESYVAANIVAGGWPPEALELVSPGARQEATPTAIWYGTTMLTDLVRLAKYEAALQTARQTTFFDPTQVALAEANKDPGDIINPDAVDLVRYLYQRGADLPEWATRALFTLYGDEDVSEEPQLEEAIRELFQAVYPRGYARYLRPEAQLRYLADAWVVVGHPARWPLTIDAVVQPARSARNRIRTGLLAVVGRNLTQYILVAL